MPEKTDTRRWTQGIVLLLIPIVVLISYANALKAPFVYDDRVHILENPLVTSFQGPLDFPAMRRVFDNPFGLTGRPLLVITYGMNYAASGANPEAFRQINLLIHVVNSFLVFLIALELANSLGIALLAALLFASHPLLIESVTYIAGRSSSLCAVLYFAGLYATLRAGRGHTRTRWVLLAMSAVFTGLGLLVKQDAITLPVACVALVWFAWPSAVSNRKRWAATAFFAFVALFTVAAQFRGIVEVSQTTQQNDALVAAGFETTLPLVPYVLTSIKAFSSYYLWRLVVPAKLSIDPDIAAVTSWFSAGFLVSFAVSTGIALLAFWIRKHRPLASLGVVLILVSPLSAYSVFPLADVIAEHRVYITALGIVILMTDLISLAPKHAVISLALLAAFTWGSIERNKVWSDEILLWKDASEKAPQKIRPHVNLGALYQSRGQIDEAIREYQFVLARAPQHSSALANLASIHLAKNDLPIAENLLYRAVATKSKFPPVYLNLGVVRLRQGRFEEARELLEHAASLNPNQLLLHLDLGDVLFNLGQRDRAIEEYLAEIKLNRNSEITHLHLAAAYEATGMMEKAIEEYRAVAWLNPTNPQAQAALQKLK